MRNWLYYSTGLFILVALTLPIAFHSTSGLVVSNENKLSQANELIKTNHQEFNWAQMDDKLGSTAKFNQILNIQNSSLDLPPVTLLFSSLFESLGKESTSTGAMVVSSDDSVIVGGSTTANSLEMIDGYDTTFNGGGSDAFLTQYLSNGKLLKSTYFGGSGTDQITKIAIDSKNNIIIAGQTDSSDLPYTENSFDFVYNGFSDIFLTKFTYDGQLVWSTYVGGSYDDIINDLSVDSNDNIYIAGSTDSSNFPSTNQSIYGETDGFIAKFLPNGSFVKSAFIGGSLNDEATDLAIHNSNIFISGTTSSSDFSLYNSNTFNISGVSDCFVISFDLDLNRTSSEFIYGGNGFESNNRMIFDNNDLIVAGTTNSSTVPSTSDYSKSTSANKTSLYINKFSLVDNSIIWSRTFGGFNFDYLSDLKLSPDGIITIAGKTNSSSTFPIKHAYDNEFSGGFDAFFSQFDSDGHLITSSFLGGASNDEINTINFDNSGLIYFSGSTLGNFPQTDTNSYLNTSNVFITKFSQFNDPYVVNTIGSYCAVTNTNPCEGLFNYPWGMTIGPDSNLYIVDAKNNRIEVLTQTGDFVRSFGSTGSELGNFSNPNGIAVRSDGKISVSDVNNHRIEIFNPDGSFYAFLDSTNGTTISTPLGLAFNGTDHLFVADLNTNLVSIYNSSLDLVDQFGGSGTDNGKFSGLAGVTVSNGLIYTSEVNNNRIQVFNAQGQYIRQWGKTGNNIGELNGVYQLFVKNNYVYAAEYSNHRIQIFTLTGSFVTTIVGSTDNNQNKFKNPIGITVNSSGYIYLTSGYLNNIIVFKPVSISNSLAVNLDYIPHYSYYSQGAYIYSSPNSLRSGFDISYSNTTRYLYAIDNTTDKIVKFSFSAINIWDASWSPVSSFGTTGAGINQFNQASDIAINLNNSYYITDTNNNRVVMYNSTDNYIKSFGKIGPENGNFSKPIGIAISEINNYIYVVDSGNNRIQYFDWNGSYIGQWGSYGTGTGQFNHPYGIAVNNKNGYVYVSDQYNNRIQIFSATGSFISTFGKQGNSAGEFDYPGHIVIDTNSYVYVTDIGNIRVQVFDENGIYKTFENTYYASYPLNFVNGIAIDYSDNLYYNYYLYNSYNPAYSQNYILKYQRYSSYITKIGLPYYTINSNQEVLSLAVNPYGKVITGGLLNNSIINFDISNQKPLSTSNIHTNPVYALDYSTDGDILASGSSDNSIILSYTNGSQMKLIGHNGPIYSLKFFSNNKLLASGSGDKTIKIWNVTNGVLVTTLANHTGGVLSIDVSPDSKTLISGSFDNTIKVWNLTTYSIITTLSAHTNFVSGVAYSPNGHYFVSISYDKRVILWNALTYTQIGQMIKHTGKIYSVAFNPDSSEFATGDETGMIYVWNVNSRKVSWQLQNHTAKVYTLKYSPDGSFLISGGADSKINIWSISNQIESDLDRDGMNDYWETLHGLSPYNFADKFLDSDSDGIINGIEALLGSNPQSNDTDNDHFSDLFEFSTGLNPIYNDDLSDLDHDGINNIYEYTYGLNLLDPTDANKDLDGDGLTNLQEFKFGSYANKVDSDSDGIPDNIEYLYGLNPLVNDAQGDLDHDGMPNLWEYQNGLILNFNDSYLDLDKDGMPNIFEYTYSFDPQNPADASEDADGDGYTNLQEYQMGTNPRDPLSPPPKVTNTTTTNSSYNLLNDPLVITGLAVVVVSGVVLSGTVVGYREYLRRKDEFNI